MDYFIHKLVVILALTVAVSHTLTDYEFLVLLNDAHSTIVNTSNFNINIKENDSEILVISISGEPDHVIPTCYNTSMGCCRPNAKVRPKPRTFEVPRRPRAGTETYCTPMGPVGVNTGGTFFYNHFEGNCVDANLLNEGAFDLCNGHPGPNGDYHFHRAPHPLCVGNLANDEPHIIGVALDGFPIYDSNIFNGVPQLVDECGGFMADNDPYQYRYVASYRSEIPGVPDGLDHVIPCYKGIPLQPRCCECRECNRLQLPDCIMGREGRNESSEERTQEGQQNGEGRRPGGFSRRPTFGNGEQPNGPFPGGRGPGGRFPGGRGPGGRFPGGRGPGGRFPGRGMFPGGRRPGGQSPGEELQGGSPDENYPEREGFCTREQLRQELTGFNQEPVDCDQCSECIPPGGYKTMEEGRRYASCRRCRMSQGNFPERQPFQGQGQNQSGRRQGVGDRFLPRGGGSNGGDTQEHTEEELASLYEFLQSLIG